MRTDVSGADVGMDWIHHLIHHGKMFFANYRVAAAATARIVGIKVGAKALHLAYELKAGAGTPISFKEGVTITVDGTPLVRRNRNRNHKDDSTLTTLFTGSTYTGGTDIAPDQAGFGSNPGLLTVGEVRSTEEIELKPNTQYAIEFTPSASTDTVLKLSFYEE